jgi:LysM repeat protein
MKTKTAAFPISTLIRKPVKRRDVIRRLWSKVGANTMHDPPAISDPAASNGEVPNMNVGRAITVIVVLHLLCIGGYFLREHIAKTKADEAAAASSHDHSSMVAINAITSAEDMPPIQPGQRQHIVTFEQSHATYASLAQEFGVSEQELRHLNNNVKIVAGLNLRIPARSAEAVVPEELARLKNHEPSANTGSNDTAILARPVPRVTQIIQPSPAAPSTAKVHTVKKGETFFSIAQMHRIDTSALQKANPNRKPASLQIGTTLKVPSR